MTPRAQMRVLYVFLAVATVLLGGCLDRKLKPLNPCLVSGVVAEIAVTNIDKVDLLFMVDNSRSMKEEQQLLRAQFPGLINVLTTGDRDNDTVQDFPPAKDLHLGVVSSDLGLPGITGIEDCVSVGDDGRMQNTPSPDVQGCQASYPAAFISYNAEINTPQQTATDFACVASLGTNGCGFEQQLESALKAVWPADDARVKFLKDPMSGFGEFGQGDPTGPNAGFLRNNVTTGISLVAIIMVTDEEDCSSKTTEHFIPDIFLADGDPRKNQGLNTRCFHYKQNLYELDKRYLSGFQSLRLGNENLVIFAGIVGVPPKLVDAEARAEVDFSDEVQRNAYYDRILADPAMIEVVDDRGSPDMYQDDNLVPSCLYGEDAKAYPPRRFVELAKMFGENGVIQSICQADFTPAMGAIIDVIAKQLGAVCLPRELVRNSKGTVGCNVVWELPPASAAVPAGTPTSCGGVDWPFLLTPDEGRAQRTERGGAVCKVAQLAVIDDVPTAVPDETTGVSYAEGWYYDNYSAEVMIECTGQTKQRVAFTPKAKPPTGVTVKLECLNETQSLADSRLDVVVNVEQPSIGDPCEMVIRGGITYMGDEACHVRLIEPTDVWTDGIDKSMFCHPELNVCVQSCSTDAECPAAWVCDDRDETVTKVGQAFCVNPTCGEAN